MNRRRMRNSDVVKIIEERKFYNLNSISVEVVGTGKMYLQEENDWIQSVIYKEPQPEGTALRTVPLSYFTENATPVYFASGDKIVAVSMGKKVAVYRVIEALNNYLAAENVETGRKESFENYIPVNGKIEPVGQIPNDPQGTEYFFLTRELEFRLRFYETKENTLKLLRDISGMLSDPTVANNLYSDKSGLDKIEAHLSDIRERVSEYVTEKD